MATVINGSDNFNTNDVATQGELDNTIAFANFCFASPNSFAMGTTGVGNQVPFNVVMASSGITGNTSAYNWTHSTTGYYVATVRYRQGTGGDVWTVFGVTKNGPSEAVGVSARTGSENGHNEAYDIFYTVDSTTATYQIQSWSGGGKTIDNAGFSQGKPSWTNYDALAGEVDANGGRTIDIIINKVGAL